MPIPLYIALYRHMLWAITLTPNELFIHMAWWLQHTYVNSCTFLCMFSCTRVCVFVSFVHLWISAFQKEWACGFEIKDRQHMQTHISKSHIAGITLIIITDFLSPLAHQLHYDMDMWTKRPHPNCTISRGINLESILRLNKAIDEPEFDSLRGENEENDSCLRMKWIIHFSCLVQGYPHSTLHIPYPKLGTLPQQPKNIGLDPWIFGLAPMAAL